MRRDTQIDQLMQKLSDEDSRASRDEGMFSGGFIVLGALQTLGYLAKRQKEVD